MRMIKKSLMKDIYLQQNDKKLMMIWNQNSITMDIKNHNRIIQRQLQMRMIKKYLKKYIYLHRKDKKIIDNLDINIIV